MVCNKQVCYAAHPNLPDGLPISTAANEQILKTPMSLAFLCITSSIPKWTPNEDFLMIIVCDSDCF